MELSEHSQEGSITGAPTGRGREGWRSASPPWKFFICLCMIDSAAAARLSRLLHEFFWERALVFWCCFYVDMVTDRPVAQPWTLPWFLARRVSRAFENGQKLATTSDLPCLCRRLSSARRVEMLLAGHEAGRELSGHGDSARRGKGRCAWQCSIRRGGGARGGAGGVELVLRLRKAVGQLSSEDG
nr:hypothetical protein CFP56_58170 [Quercus suber]